MKLTELLSGVDAILMSHLHKDHFHGLGGFPFLAAKPVLAPNPVAASLARRGFAAKGIGRGLDFGGLRVRATPAAHGRGLSRLLMGKAWGFLVSEPDAPPIYVAGDGLWNASMRRLIDREKPCAVILNAGSARISLGKPITMDSADVAAVLSHAERAKVVAVHLDAFNHCLETREELQNALIAHPGAGRLAVPHDGDELPLED
jgi:L-ascorbate metabolism protein UlaG (beta-lactamase superfamily)